jgi:hypothetical protein
LPPDLARQYGSPLQAAAAADTFLLHEATFDGPGGELDPMGYTTRDMTGQIAVFWHVADGTELDGGDSGNLVPLSGARSMWCGQDASSAVPFCAYATLPGYGNGWEQILVSDALSGDSLSISYKVFWDSEGGYDGTEVEYAFDDVYWYRFPVTDSYSDRPDLYDNTGPTPFITETFAVGSSGASSIKVRFRFRSDGAWSDEDGLWPTDGAVMVDDITIDTWSGGVAESSNTEDFESASVGSNTAGIWTGDTPPAFGDYAALYPGVTLLQEDPCMFVNSYAWAFFDDPANSNYGCAGYPEQGAIPKGNANCDYIANRIQSPLIPYTGSGDEVRLRFLVYRDLPLDNLVFYTWAVRSWADGCPSEWRDGPIYYGGQKDWLNTNFSIGQLVDPNASHIQVAVGVWDGCGVWCLFGCSATPEGSCRGGAPYIDDIRVERIAAFGPQYTVRHLELFQDNFAEDGTLTGTARADAAIDILPWSSPGILPGDSVTMTIAPIAGDPNTGVGPAAYAYIRVQNSNAPKPGAALGSGDTRAGLPGNRWPHITDQMIGGHAWAVLRMDSAITVSGHAVADRYCIDLNDNLFVPGDTIWYFFGADADATPNSGNESYWHRTLDGQGSNNVTADISEAAADPCEFTILPAGGWNRGGDILYVDDTDDRGGPAQLSFDSAFDMMTMGDLVDRYDVLGTSSAVGNSLASRVKDNVTQIIDNYKTIIWNTGNLSSGLVGDGTGDPEKSNDWGLLYQFLDTSDLGPGLYLSGDDIAEEWVTLAGTGAIQTRSVYMNFNRLDRNHINHGESVSPTLTATGASFIHLGVPDVLIAYGGCPTINDFDVLQPTGTAITEFPYPSSGNGAVISQQTTNSAAQTATVVLSGFSYHTIRDAGGVWPPARVEHLRDILIKCGTLVGPVVPGVEPGAGPQYANALFNNYPNPFNPTTTIKYTIKERAHVSLEIYNAAGQLVRTLVDEVQSPDEVKPVEWDGHNNAGQTVSSGVYFYRLVTKNFSQTKKMVVLK